MKTILDACCGSKMMWFDKNNPNVIFGDNREETIIRKDKSSKSGKRIIKIEPDTLLNFTNLPFKDNRFKLVIFDPPHLKSAGNKSWLAAKYGILTKNWQEELKKGFSECFRVLEDKGILVFKWSELNIKLNEILKLTNIEPLIGHRSGRRTHWLVFMKV